MKSFHPLVVGFAGVLLLANFCPTAAADTAKVKADVIASDADDGKTIHLKANQTLEIRLSGNATTGYGWYAVGGRDNDGKATGNMVVGVLAPSDEQEYVADPAPKGTTGSGGTEVFRYFARKPGTATLRFIYMQPWEGSKVSKRESFNVVVE